ncbi:hypothetical protein RclHR1_09200014 [Rhizophagus clarus]|uniref:Uncharacterized protein n=1 Tax=Rhizophagus clarus TaxID=94130 RepID=A0A2Z6SQ59_9GLOM|nr:hypothetical protein RclHR1_09200014 [Rhizophagus clarus]GES75850.1 hypothetical protein RCL_jg20155.t1 [Rhizophagus clarus]
MKKARGITLKDKRSNFIYDQSSGHSSKPSARHNNRRVNGHFSHSILANLNDDEKQIGVYNNLYLPLLVSPPLLSTRADRLWKVHPLMWTVMKGFVIFLWWILGSPHFKQYYIYIKLNYFGDID